MMAKRVLITGATGFVGANLVRRMLYDGHAVHVLVRPSYTAWRIADIRNEVVLHEGSLADRDWLMQTIAIIRPDWLFHLAVYGAYSWQTNLDEIVQTTLMGTVNLVQAACATGFEAFVNTGSSSEYGFKDHAPSEKEWLEPNSHYAVAKAAATMFCRYTAQSQDVHIPTLRLYSVYGPYEDPGRLMPTLIQHGLRGELPLLVNPDIARDYVYSDDVNEAYVLAATCSGQELGAVYNVGTGIQTTLRDVVAVARDVLGITVEPQWGSMPSRQWDTTTWYADNRTIRAALGWQPQYTFAEGFARMVEWVRRYQNISIK